MASVARSSPICRPSCSLQYLRAPQQARSFTSSRSNLAANSTTASSSQLLKNMPMQHAMGSRIRKLRRSEIPDDIGLVPQTFIRPCGNMPSWFSEPITRLKLEWLYLKQMSIDFGQLVYLQRWGVKKDPITQKPKKQPLQLRDRIVKARDLHTNLFTALAAGSANDVRQIKEIACSGLVNEQKNRLDRRTYSDMPPQSWSVKYRGWVLSPKIPFSIQALIPSWFKAIHTIADRQFSLPIGEGVTVRQIILRVDSTQTLDRNDGSQPTIKKLREYVVLQKMIHEDEIEEWKIWGTTEPSTKEEAMDMINFTKSNSTSMVDRVRGMLPM